MKKEPRYHQGKFTPRNLDKYRGTVPIKYLSGLELQFLRWCDKNPRVIKWSYEPGRKTDPHKRVWYHCPVRNSDHYYIIDAWIRYYDSQNVLRETYVEIKPMNQVIKPKPTGRGWKSKLAEWTINQAKWAAAKKYAKKQNKGFVVLTEKFWSKQHGETSRESEQTDRAVPGSGEEWSETTEEQDQF